MNPYFYGRPVVPYGQVYSSQQQPRGPMPMPVQGAVRVPGYGVVHGNPQPRPAAHQPMPVAAHAPHKPIAYGHIQPHHPVVSISYLQPKVAQPSLKSHKKSGSKSSLLSPTEGAERKKENNVMFALTHEEEERERIKESSKPDVEEVPMAERNFSPRVSRVSRGQTLRKGMTIDFSENEVKMGKMLGFGTFGSVWEAEMKTNAMPLALKEMITGPHFPLKDALYEIDVQRRLTHKTNRAKHRAIHAPTYVSHEVFSNDEADRTVVRMIMERVDGIPIDKWMYDLETSVFKTIMPDHVPLGDRTAAVAHHCTAQMLKQLGPAFEVLDDIAFHRDVNAHNIMVNEQDGELTFTLIDFGMSHDSRSWREGVWRTGAIGGDVRYWSPSSWIQYMYGAAQLEAFPHLIKLYSHRIDHFALGFLGMEMLLGLMATDEAPELEDLRAVWDEYFFYHLHLFQTVMGEFQGNLGTARQRLIEENTAVNALMRLQAVLAAAEKVTGPSAELVKTLSDLMSHECKIEWADLQDVQMTREE